jgi:hypothetical protein
MFLYSTVSTLKPASVSSIAHGRTDGRNGGYNLAKLELVENGGLTGRVKTDHENTCHQYASKPTDIRISFLPKRPWRRRETERPMLATFDGYEG